MLAERATDPAGNLWIGDGAAIRKLYPQTGAVVTVAGNATINGSTDGSPPAARFWSPTALIFDNTQGAQVFVTDTNISSIRKLQ